MHLCFFAMFGKRGNDSGRQSCEIMTLDIISHTHNMIVSLLVPCIYNRWILLSHILIEVLCISGVILLFLIICSTTVLALQLQHFVSKCRQITKAIVQLWHKDQGNLESRQTKQCNKWKAAAKIRWIIQDFFFQYLAIHKGSKQDNL